MPRFEWDPEARAAYLRLAADIEDGAVVKNVAVQSVEEGVEYEIILDFDEGNRLLGIEILNAPAALGQEALVALLADNV